MLQLDSRSEQYLENISQLQLYEYQLDENLCPNAPPAPSAMSDPFNYHTNESQGYTDNRSTCFDDDEDDPLTLQVSATSKRSKDNLRYLRSKDSSRSEGTLRSTDTSSGGERSSYPHMHTTKMEGAEAVTVAAAVDGGAVVERSGRRQVGLLAQEVQRVLPNAVRATVSFKCVCAYVYSLIPRHIPSFKNY